MPAKKKSQKPPAEGKRIAAFEGARSKPRSGNARPRRASQQSSAREGGAQSVPELPRERGGRALGQGQPKNPGANAPVPEATEPQIDPRFDPEVMFRILSDKIAAKVDRAAMKAGASAAQEVSRQLTAELDAAIAGAQSTAGKMGTLVQQAVQAAVDEALRTAVLNATRVHEEHLAQLALIDRTAQTVRDLPAVQLRIDAELRRSGLSRVTAPDPEVFNLVNPTEHEDSASYVVVAPAYVDSRTSRVVQRGEMRRVPAESTPQGSESQ
ncbi:MULTISPECIES: hypothetical protein [Streptomyces]|uniref:hypothetical protein n=1 Tax=Streptomyces TaxID=1883 RepID=UPI002060F7B0|nr:MULTISPECIES: hypothetical protein [Streptomyces]UPT45790.1 hypothetical protein MWG59_33015 [Streptomyces sp. WAC00303]WIY79914.1 hypothetical protein QPM16_32680 [Streptomyces anulatus]